MNQHKLSAWLKAILIGVGLCAILIPSEKRLAQQ